MSAFAMGLNVTTLVMNITSGVFLIPVVNVVLAIAGLWLTVVSYKQVVRQDEPST